MWDKDAVEGRKERKRGGEASAMAVSSGMSGGQGGGEGAQIHHHIQTTIRESGEGRLLISLRMESTAILSPAIPTLCSAAITKRR